MAVVITIVSPDVDDAPGNPGAFSSDYLIARDTEIVVEITGAVFELVAVTYPDGSKPSGRTNEEVVYRAGAFRQGYAARSVEEAIAGGKRLRVKPDGVWPTTTALHDVRFEIDGVAGAASLTPPNEWLDGGGTSNVPDGSNPNTASAGTSVNAAALAYGAWTQLLTPTAFATYWIEININSLFVNGQSLEGVINIGVDPLGGAAPAVVIPHLIGSQANFFWDSGEWQTGGGINYAFPITIPAGSTVWAQASFSSIASRSACNVGVRLRGNPTRPDLVWSGTTVQAFGAVSAATFGTAIVPGAGAVEGAWTAIGGAPASRLRYLEWGLGLQNAAVVPTMLEVDLGVDTSGVKRVVNRANHYTASNESARKDRRQGAWCDVLTTDLVFARAQQSSGPLATHKLAAYGVY